MRMLMKTGRQRELSQGTSGFGTCKGGLAHPKEEHEGDDGGPESVLAHGLVALVCTMAMPTLNQSFDQQVVQVARAPIWTAHLNHQNMWDTSISEASWRGISRSQTSQTVSSTTT